ncbi:peptidoglycan-binding protein [Arthrobacter sp. 35W]|uniref:peptidoglycan-binding protein n=1 Tax=Arthrobacter sp. 35W TaxID=1132441 RepID=UPI00042953F7|nr:peptidoglycan-binding protein [Arthrobacter sp. 35W]
MRSSVRNYWLEFNSPLEGRVHFMYLDVKGYVSTGVGNLIDATKQPLTAPTPAERSASLAMAWAIAWARNDDGAGAVQDEIAAEWDTVKSRMDLAHLGGGHFAPPVTSLCITDEEIDRIVFQRLDAMESYLRGRPPFADFDNWPADAQLGLLSMSWGMGPAFKFPKFQGFAAQRDWTSASSECRFNPEIGTIVKRNNLDQQCFLNAARVDAEGLDPEVLLIAGGAPTPVGPVDPPAGPVLDLAQVAGIQAALTALGYSPGPVDGLSGPRTTAAIRQFQADQGLSADGIAGPLTRAALAAALGQIGIQTTAGG